MCVTLSNKRAAQNELLYYASDSYFYYVSPTSTSTFLPNLGQDLLRSMAAYLHPMELAKLSLCSKALMDDLEGIAQQFYLCQEAHDTHNQIGAEDIKTWRYRYFCSMEVAMAEPEKLKLALAEIYENRIPHKDQLNLYGLHMGDDGAEHLALALRVSKFHKVVLVNLSGNDLSDRGAQAIVMALRASHEEVKTLCLSQNRIGPQGAECLAQYIASSHNLHSLSLSENPIRDEGAKCISQALHDSSSLCCLSMRGMDFSSQVREGIRTTWGGRGGDSVFGLYL